MDMKIKLQGRNRLIFITLHAMEMKDFFIIYVKVSKKKLIKQINKINIITKWTTINVIVPFITYLLEATFVLSLLLRSKSDNTHNIYNRVDNYIFLLLLFLNSKNDNILISPPIFYYILYNRDNNYIIVLTIRFSYL